MLAQRPDPALGKRADVSGLDAHQPVLLGKGQRAQHDRVHQREDSRIGPDPQGEREHCRQGESW
jgi:hypothetical protein